MSDIVIAAAKRTAIGSFLGQFTGVPSPTLGAAAIQAALKQSGIPAADVSEVIMGCVLPANLGQAPARQASLAAGLPISTGCTTINKVCGSGMKAIMLGHDLIKAGSASVVVAGGMESMTNAPHMIPNSRTGNRFGDFKAVDHMSWDGLVNPYDGQAMGVFAESTAEKYGFSARRAGRLQHRIGQSRPGRAAVRRPSPTRSSRSRSPRARARLRIRQATNSPANPTSPRFPASSRRSRKTAPSPPPPHPAFPTAQPPCVLMRADEAAKRGLTPLARIVGHSTFSQEPQWFTTAPVGAIEKLLKQVGWKVDDVDLFEINEAFAVVAMAPIKDLGIPHAKVNVNGGACALGHPIGASGARLVVTLIHALRKRGGTRGVASLCIGGGEATAIAIEVL